MQRAGTQSITHDAYIGFGETGDNRQTRIRRRPPLLNQSRFEGLDVDTSDDARDLTRGDAVLKCSAHERTHKRSEHIQDGFFFRPGHSPSPLDITLGRSTTYVNR